jgi:hypothetical protein
MSSLLYLGESPKDQQVIAENLASRGINYIRIEPSKIVPVMYLENVVPSYTIYKNHIGAFIKAAVTKEPVTLDKCYFPLESTGQLSCAPVQLPVIFSFSTKLRDETRDAIKGKYKVEDTLAKGKPALQGLLTISQIRELVKDYEPIQTTASSSTHVNIHTIRDLRVLYRIVNAFVRTHQYPSMVDGDEDDKEGERVEVTVPVAKDVKDSMELDDEVVCPLFCVSELD